MYVRHLSVSNIRSIDKFEMRFEPQERVGWHVILGANGAGKTSVVTLLRRVPAVLEWPVVPPGRGR